MTWSVHHFGAKVSLPLSHPSHLHSHTDSVIKILYSPQKCSHISQGAKHVTMKQILLTPKPCKEDASCTFAHWCNFRDGFILCGVYSVYLCYTGKYDPSLREDWSALCWLLGEVRCAVMTTWGGQVCCDDYFGRSELLQSHTCRVMGCMTNFCFSCVTAYF